MKKKLPQALLNKQESKRLATVSAVTDAPTNKETLTTVDTPAELPKVKVEKSLDDIEFDFSDIKPPKSK